MHTIAINAMPRLPKSLVAFVVLNCFFTKPFAHRSSSLGCGEDRETGEPQATAHVQVGGDNYRNGTLFLVIDWGDNHGIRETYNLSDIHGTRLNFEHNYENVTDPNDWSYPLLLHADVELPNQEDLLLDRIKIVCGMNKSPAKPLDSAAKIWKSSAMLTLFLLVTTFRLAL